MEFKILAEDINDITEAAIAGTSRMKGDKFTDALTFFNKKVLPDGSHWGGRLTPAMGFNNAPARSREKKKPMKDGGFQYTARLRMAPGKGGGGGAGIPPVASNQLFCMMGADGNTISKVSKAFDKYVHKYHSKLNESLRVWLRKKDNFIHHIVGWSERNKYEIGDVTFKNVRYETPMVDPARRKWPAGRTEIWQPVVADVIIEVKRKKVK